MKSFLILIFLFICIQKKQSIAKALLKKSQPIISTQVLSELTNAWIRNSRGQNQIIIHWITTDNGGFSWYNDRIKTVSSSTLELRLLETSMRTFRLEQSDKKITSHVGMALIGAAITKHTSLAQVVDAALPKRHGTPSSDWVKLYIGLLAQGKNDFEAINNIRGDDFFHQAFDLKKGVPTEASVRTRFEEEVNELTPLINQGNVEFLVNRKVPVTPLYTGHIPLDIDVTPHDNSNSKKENVSRTYKGMDGFEMSCVKASNTANVSSSPPLSEPLVQCIR